MVVLLVLMTSAMYAKDEDVLRPKGRSDGGGSSSSSSSSSSWKPDIKVGVEAGINLNFFSQNATGLPPGYPEIISSGFGVAPYLSIFADVGLSPTVGIQARLSYDMKDFSSSGTHELPCADQLGTVNTATIDYKGNDYIRYYDVAFLLRWSVSKDIVLLGGPIYQSLASASSRIEQTILSPDNCFFNLGQPNQSKTSVVEGSTEGVVTAERVGIDLGVGYVIPLNPTTWLVPRLGGQFFLTPLADDRVTANDPYFFSAKNAQLHSLQLGLGLWFSI